MRPSSGGPASDAAYPIVATTLMLRTAARGSSPAADIPIGKPSAEPNPHNAAPATATAGTGAVMKHPMPTAAHSAETRRAPTRPNRWSTAVPSSRVTVVATTNTQNVTAPTAGATR